MWNMDDDLLFAAEVEGQGEEGKKQEQMKHLLKNVIIPLQPDALFTPHFKQIMEDNSQINLNVFIIGYKCDQGVRACGGRSGSELGPDSFRELLHAPSSSSDG